MNKEIEKLNQELKTILVILNLLENNEKLAREHFKYAEKLKLEKTLLETKLEKYAKGK